MEQYTEEAVNEAMAEHGVKLAEAMVGATQEELKNRQDIMVTHVRLRDDPNEKHLYELLQMQTSRLEQTLKEKDNTKARFANEFARNERILRVFYPLKPA